MKKPKLIRWSDDGYPPIDLNEQLPAVIELIDHSRSLESQVKELREALAEVLNDVAGAYYFDMKICPSESVKKAEQLLNKQP